MESNENLDEQVQTHLTASAGRQPNYASNNILNPNLRGSFRPSELELILERQLNGIQANVEVYTQPIDANNVNINGYSDDGYDENGTPTRTIWEPVAINRNQVVEENCAISGNNDGEVFLTNNQYRSRNFSV